MVPINIFFDGSGLYPKQSEVPRTESSGRSFKNFNLNFLNLRCLFLSTSLTAMLNIFLKIFTFFLFSSSFGFNSSKKSPPPKPEYRLEKPPPPPPP